jgi:HEAT repeat protein
MLAAMRLLVLVVLASCGGHAGQPPLVASSARLPAPRAVDPGQRGAGYLTLVAGQFEPRWTAFLEDCRLRLPASHPLNATTLAATFEIAVGRDGAIAWRRPVAASGNGDFDSAVADVLADASPLPAPPAELVSDDDLVHVRWQFARDRRQAGPATARVVDIELPLATVVPAMLDRGELGRAARRVAAAPAAEREAAAAPVMVAALGEALAGPDTAARRAAVEACGRARVGELAGAVRALLAETTEPELQLAAINATGALGDRDAAPLLAGPLRDDLARAPRTALARIAALVAIGRAEDAGAAVRAALHGYPTPASLTALEALDALAAPRLAGAPRFEPGDGLQHWLEAFSFRGDAAIRGAVCLALPGGVPRKGPAMLARGMRDADATVRASCAAAAGRAHELSADPSVVTRLRELARDRDRSVRARAIAALAALDPAHPVRAVDDEAPEVRAAYAAAASLAELELLAADAAPEVRAAALAALADRAGDPSAAALHAAADPSPVVRGAAVAVLTSTDALTRLAGDDSPEVATAALVRLTTLRGRTAATPDLLARLAEAPPASLERVRIALAWLLAW